LYILISRISVEKEPIEFIRYFASFLEKTGS